MIKFIITLIFILLAQITYAGVDSYYVTQSGAGSRNGLTIQNAWSLSDFNTSSNWSSVDDIAKIDPGDSVYLSGEFTQRIIIRGSGTSDNYITIDGGGAKILSPISTNQKIIDVSNVQYLIFKNLYIDGQDSNMTAASNLAAIYIRQLGSTTGHITIQDSTFKNSSSGIILQGNVKNIVIIRNSFENMVGNGVSVSMDHYDNDSDYFYNDCPNIITIGGSKGNGNTFRNVGKLRADEAVPGYAFGIFGKDIIFSYNHIYANLANIGAGIYMNGAQKVLVEYNTIHGMQAVKHRPPIDFKCDPLKSSDNQYLSTEDIIIRFNKVYDIYNGPNVYAFPPSAIRISGRGKNRVIYGNFLEGADINLNWNWTEENEGLGGTGYFVWSNIVNGAQTSGGITISGYSLNVDKFKDWHIYNNTIYKTVQNHTDPTSPYYHYAISTTDNALTIIENLNIKNNIVANTRPNSNEYVNNRIPNSPETHFDYNHHYFAGQVPKIILIESSGTHTYTWNSSSLPTAIVGHNTEGDPKFTAADAGNFSLLPGSPCIDSGLNLSQADSTLPTITIQGQLLTFSYSTALNPKSTDWTTIPPTVGTINQNNNENWEKGAYVFVTNAINAPKNLNIR